MTNLFEQQAIADRLIPVPPPVFESPALTLARILENADLALCADAALYLAGRLLALEKQHGGMKAANINEAAHLAMDARVDIVGAMEIKEEIPCACGKCDTCVAARSDEHHGRNRDAQDALAAHTAAAGG